MYIVSQISELRSAWPFLALFLMQFFFASLPSTTIPNHLLNMSDSSCNSSDLEGDSHSSAPMNYFMIDDIDELRNILITCPLYSLCWLTHS